MKNFNLNKIEDLRITQIIDANLDRAREGLRVLEDWARFALGRKDLVQSFKDFRHILGKHHLKIYKESRNFINDECKGISHPEQLHRKNTDCVITSNAARVQEALRVIEEFSRNHNQDLFQSASKIRYDVYNLEIELLEANLKNNLRQKLLENNLYFITHKTDNLIGITKSLLEGGVRLVQFRCKHGNDSDNLKEAINLKKLCQSYGALFIVNDRIDIAFASNADGVHLGQNDLDIISARRILGYSKIIGISASNEFDIQTAIEGGCDYLGIGPVFKTTTKKYKPTLGLDYLKKLTNKLSIPWFAIGGIKEENINSLTKSKITKVAMISELINAINPKEKANMIIKSLSNEN